MTPILDRGMSRMISLLPGSNGSCKHSSMQLRRARLLFLAMRWKSVSLAKYSMVSQPKVLGFGPATRSIAVSVWANAVDVTMANALLYAAMNSGDPGSWLRRIFLCEEMRG